MAAMFVYGSKRQRNEQSLYRTFHRCFLSSFGSFGKAVSEEKIFRNRPIRNKNCMWAVPDLPLCLGVLKHRASLARGPHLPAKNIFTMDFCLCGAILNLKAFCFGAIPDIMIELIAYWSVPQSRQS